MTIELSISWLVCMAAFAYFFYCLNQTLLERFLFIWITFLCHGIVAVVEFAYFIFALVAICIPDTCTSLMKTISKIVRNYICPYLSVLFTLAYLVLYYIFDPFQSSPEGFYMMAVVMMLSGGRIFIIYTTLTMNSEAFPYTSSEESAEEQVEMMQRGPIAYIPQKLRAEQKPKKAYVAMIPVMIPGGY